MSILGSLTDNALCIQHTLNAATAVTMTNVFGVGVNTVMVTSDADVPITFLWGGAPPAAAGDSSAAATGSVQLVGPSYPPAIFHSAAGSRTIGIKNLHGSTNATLYINGWRSISLKSF